MLIVKKLAPGKPFRNDLLISDGRLLFVTAG
jgi:hypothetical protein